MQKRDSSGSILIWSLFFSTFIAFMFISISTSINKNIKDSSSLSESIDRELLSESFEKKPLDGILALGENEEIKKVESFYALQKDETHEFRFDSSSDFNVSISIQKGGPLSYIFLASSWATNQAVTASWVIESTTSFNSWFTWWQKNGFLYIKNLAGYTEYELTSDGTIIPEKETYIKTKTYGGYEVEKGVYEIINFTGGSFPWINYNSFWMEF